MVFIRDLNQSLPLISFAFGVLSHIGFCQFHPKRVKLSFLRKEKGGRLHCNLSTLELVRKPLDLLCLTESLPTAFECSQISVDEILGLDKIKVSTTLFSA